MYNKAIDAAAVEGMRKALAEVKDKHTKNATPPEDMKNNRKGKGAQDMMKPADDAIKNPAVDEIDMVNKDANKMTANVKPAKNVANKKANKGDQDIVGPGTPMPKDPAMVKPGVKESRMKELESISGKTIDEYAEAYGKKKVKVKEENANKPRWIQEALADNEILVKENILSRLTGGHGRYMKKLQAAHDHHDTMLKAHSDMESHIDPSRGEDPDKNRDPDHQYIHGRATESHLHARNAIKSLMSKAKKEKLTSHPKGSEEYFDAAKSSAEANNNSRKAMGADRNRVMARGRVPSRSKPISGMGYASKNYDTHPAEIVSQNFVKGHGDKAYSKGARDGNDQHKSLD